MNIIAIRENENGSYTAFLRQAEFIVVQVDKEDEIIPAIKAVIKSWIELIDEDGFFEVKLYSMDKMFDK